ncbi:MAG: Ca-activated chloride channel [Phycisphaerales bacterium]|jgi:Ca-activated chloride channel family protein|nr:Ca-activated chloride channel [Phycisphaerales bacterium]
MKSDDEMKLTAYALDELSASERAAAEARVRNDAAARAEVEKIRDVAKLLSSELAAEPAPVVKPIEMPQQRRRRLRWGGRLAIAAAVSVVVGGIAFSVLAPSLNRAREASIRAQDASNLRQMEQPQLLSSNDNRGTYPRTATPPQSQERQVNSQPTPMASAVDGKGVNDAEGSKAGDQSEALNALPTPALPLLKSTGGYAVLTAPSSNAEKDTFGRDTNAQINRNNFTSRLRYSYQNPYEGTAAVGSGFELNQSPRSEFAVTDDVNQAKHNTEAYDRVVDNAFLDVMQNPLSTFSIDVDTASYANVRRFLSSGQRPPKDAVRIEEMVNYFPYDYAPPAKSDERPFATHVEIADCPWQPEHRLVRVGIKGKEIAADKRPASNLVFLLDVSGSMQPENRLPMVKRSMRLLLDQLNAEDRVAIVVYAGTSGLVLPSTACSEGAKDQIRNAIETLSAGGSTNGEQGIQLAYSVAKQNFVQGGTNRVILCTDGDFNVGVTNQGDLTRIIEEKAKAGVFLSVLGYGMGNLKDSTMEKLADKGNGNYAYIDTLNEAKKVLVEQMSGTLVTIAKDVKIQIEFNPAVVESYRLIGYENRLLAKEDFNDDKKDAGEIGAGHSVTALYEVTPVGKQPDTKPAVDSLKYQKPASAATTGRGGDDSGEMLTLKLRYKQPDGDTSALIETPVKDTGGTFAKSSRDFKFASSVAAFGMILRDSPHKGRATYPAVQEWAEDGVGEDKGGYRQEFLELVKSAKKTAGQ